MKDRTQAYMENLVIITNNLLDFIKKDYQNPQLLHLTNETRKNYKNPMKNLISGNIYKVKRKRLPQIDQFIHVIQTSKIENERIQAFYTLISRGKWLDTSFNTHFFEALLSHLDMEIPLDYHQKNDFFQDLLHAVQSLTVNSIPNLEFNKIPITAHEAIIERFLEYFSSGDIKKSSNSYGWATLHGQTLDSLHAGVWMQQFDGSKDSQERASALWKLINDDRPIMVELFRNILFKKVLNEIAPDYLKGVVFEEKFLAHFIMLLKGNMENTTFLQNNRMERSRELESMFNQNVRKNMDFVHIFSDKDSAQKDAFNRPDLAVFYVQKNTNLSLKNNSDKWQLFWFDPYGKSYQLRATNELIALLGDSDNLSNYKPVRIAAIRTRCLEAKTVFLDKIKIKTDGSVETQNLCSTFVLKREISHCELTWYDQTGKPREIDLSKYKILQEWLEKQVNWFEETNDIFKSFLPSIDTRNALVCENDLREKLENQFASQKFWEKPVKNPQQQAAPKEPSVRAQAANHLLFAPPPPPPTAQPTFTFKKTN